MEIKKKHDHRQRKLVICSVCEKEKLNFGFNMCSACLRHHKRKTRPSFYLGTCYSELSRRIKTYDEQRPNYFGRTKCTREEFIDAFINDENFLKQYKIWQENEYQRGFAPSIDRIDNLKDYTLDNLRFIDNVENGVKDKRKPLTIKKGEISHTFRSMSEAADFIGVGCSNMTRGIKTNKKVKGWSLHEES